MAESSSTIPIWRFAPAVDGLGIAYAAEAVTDPFLRSGQLIPVLEDWSSSFEGFFPYYPGHRQVPVGLRALIDMLRTTRGGRHWPKLTPAWPGQGSSACRRRLR
jgi:hypothetical protein